MDFTVGFHFNTHCAPLTKQKHECTVKIDEILSIVKKQNKKWKELSRSFEKVHVLSVSVQGHNADTPIEIKITDAQSRDFTTFTPLKRQQDGTEGSVRTVGAPLFPNSADGKLIYEGSPLEINEEWFSTIYGEDAVEVTIN